jgi:hypothetical protein
MKPTIFVAGNYSPSAKAEASKVSDRPVPVLKVTFSGERRWQWVPETRIPDGFYPI